MLAERRSQSHRPRQFEIEFKAIERERRRVAKELHDEILPSLARLIRSIESQDAEQQYIGLTTALHNMVAAFRDLLGELHPVDLEELGLVAGLHNLCARYSRLTGLSILFHEGTEDCALSEFQQLCLYRAFQLVLRMYSVSGNDILVVTCDEHHQQTVITMHCVDKMVAPFEWLSPDRPEYDVFDSLCALASARAEIGAPRKYEFSYDLVLRVEPNAYVPQHPTLKNTALFENLAVQAERQRISDDIQTLILPHLERCSSVADGSDNILLSHAIRDRMQLIAAGVKAVLGEAHPQLLEQAGLVPSIMTLVDRFTRASLIETTIVADLSSADVDISSDAKFAIYRATQEALNNVEKHSGATHARIAIRREPEALVVEVEDNGKGFEQQASVQSRGLKNIRERAAAIGANVHWQHSVSFSTGTLVCIALPYR
jgi:signal transduction histidine kinase